MIPQTTELGQIQAAFIDKDNRIEELMRQINSAQSLLNSLKETMNSFVGDGKITIQTYAGSNVGDFTVNQKEDKTITLPQQATVNNGTLTIQKNGTSVGTFTANQSGNTTANITVPTKTSEITNDSNFVSDANYVHTDNNFTNADKAEIGKINNSLQFTYVVDNDQKLEDWANRVAGNDYTSVLIKKGTWTYSASSGINLTATGTKVIVGEAGSKIIINKTSSGTGTGISYDTLPTTNDYFISNLTLEYNATSGRALSRCVNLTNCQIVANGDSTTTNITGLEGCVNILRCDAKAYQSDVGNYSIGYRDCSNIRESSGYGKALTRGSGFYGCNSVQFCKDTSTTPYYYSYSSPIDNATYACANTLNGGWNQ